MANLTEERMDAMSPDSGELEFTVADTVQIYAGALVGLNSSGYLVNFDDATGITFVGHASETVLGDTSASSPPKCKVDHKRKLELNRAVTGVSGITDVGSPVYATDNQVLTLTRPATFPQVVGKVYEYVASGKAHVLFHSFAEAALQNGRLKTVCLGQYDLDLAAGEFGFNAYEALQREKVIGFYGVAQNGAGASADITDELNIDDGTGNTAVGGGTIQWQLADAQNNGSKKSASLSGSDDVIEAGQTLTLERTETTGFTGGNVNYFVQLLAL